MPRGKAKKADTEVVSGAAEVVACPSSMDISAAEALQHQFEEVLGRDCPVRLNAAGVENADTACLQLICILRQELQSRDLDLEWDQPSEALASAARLLGLTEALGLQA